MIRLTTFTIIVMCLCGWLLPGCYYDVEEELYPSTGCDTIDVSFSGEVVDLLSQYCYDCHDGASNFGGVSLEGYESLKAYVTSGQLLGVIRHESGFSPMPKNQEQMVDCDIQKIETWISAGAPNN